jgi:ATP-dependent Lhr-like helicase
MADSTRKKTRTVEPLAGFHDVLREWFLHTFHEPTPAQTGGWPSIREGRNTLILAPTGSGKTLAAFLAGIDELIIRLEKNRDINGVFILYISPLKALGYDIERNLERPLAGIRAIASRTGKELPEIRVAVRTGDTSQRERARMLRCPPHILITTPESLHLMLTSGRARENLRQVKWVIVDEIHTIAAHKRGVFLAVLLERLQHITHEKFVRIGLSATQRPLDEIARFLGGSEWIETHDTAELAYRPVHIVDAGIRRNMDLQVTCPVQDLANLPDDSVWPSIYRMLLDLILSHTSTLIFANNRRVVERIAAEVNLLARQELVRAHHSSISKEERRKLELQLKKGELPALAATASLELGIDMGAVDLVCQVESPKSVTTGLQRVGRAGHVYTATSKGRLIPKMRSDLLDISTVARGMLKGEVDHVRIPRNCLDILAQQIIAMTAVQPRKVEGLFKLLRQAYPYRDLPYAHFINVIEMVSGRYPPDIFKELKPRVSWDRVHQVLHPLPGSRHIALVNGGAIPDTGQYGVYMEGGGKGQVKLGELDEECVYETRVGDAILLGTNTWRVTAIDRDRVKVIPASGRLGKMPFWKGEFVSRSFETGKKMGEFCRKAVERLHDPSFDGWTRRTCRLDTAASRNLAEYLSLQIDRGTIVPDDRHILMETFRDETGEAKLALLSPFGGTFHLTWRLAILGKTRESWGIEIESLHNDSGILFRLNTGEIESLVDAIRDIRPEDVRRFVIAALGDSPFFGLRFRHTAARSLLLPRFRPGRRTPLWLMRMKARNLLELSRQYDNFPVIVETFRECIQDHLLLPELEEVLRDIEKKKIEVVVTRNRIPSPFVSTLLFDFTAEYLYEYDTPKASVSGEMNVDRDFLDELLAPDEMIDLTDPSILEVVERRKRHEEPGTRARTLTELVEILRMLGDQDFESLKAKATAGVVNDLAAGKASPRLLEVQVPGVPTPERWIAAEDFPLYRDAFSSIPEAAGSYDLLEDALVAAPGYDKMERRKKEDAWRTILRKHIGGRARVTLEELIVLYPFGRAFIEKELRSLEGEKKIFQLVVSGDLSWIQTYSLKQAHRMTIVERRARIVSCDPSRYIRFLLEWQGCMPGVPLSRSEGDLYRVVEQLQGCKLPAKICEGDILARRMEGYSPQLLDRLIQSGQILWWGSSGGRDTQGYVFFSPRASFSLLRTARMGGSPAQIDHPLYGLLRDNGASFFSDLVVRSGLRSRDVLDQLRKWVKEGVVTNDSFDAVRSGRSAGYLPDGGVEGGRSMHRYPGRIRSSSRKGKREVFAAGGSGRWSLLPSFSASGKTLEREDLESLAYIVLDRYGIICREIFDFEDYRISWHDMIRVLDRLEWRGEIRRGLFVRGFSGIQFALPPAADRLCTSPERTKKQSSMVLVHAMDPVNLYGAGAPLPVVRGGDRTWRFYRNTKNYMLLHRGSPCIAIEGAGKRWYPLIPLTGEILDQALECITAGLLSHQPLSGRRGNIEVQLWDDRPVQHTDASIPLQRIGYERTPKGLIFYRRAPFSPQQE